MVGVEAARPGSLFLKVFIGHNDDKISTGFDKFPPPAKRVHRIMHVFQAVAGVDTIVALHFKHFIDGFGVALVEIERFGVGHDKVVAGTDVDYPPGHIGVEKHLAANLIGLFRFKHELIIAPGH